MVQQTHITLTWCNSHVGSGSNRIPWTEKIDKTQTVMIGVPFTNSRRIKKGDIDELKARYQILDNQQMSYDSQQ